MPYRDDFGRLCGALVYKDEDGNWNRKLAILDEDECLLRFFNPYAFCPVRTNQNIFQNTL